MTNRCEIVCLTAEGLVPAEGDAPLAAAMASPPATAQLYEMAHWVAPDSVPVRFDARYFGVAASAALMPAADGHEAEEAWWASPRALLEGWAGRFSGICPDFPDGRCTGFRSNGRFRAPEPRQKGRRP